MNQKLVWIIYWLAICSIQRKFLIKKTEWFLYIFIYQFHCSSTQFSDEKDVKRDTIQFLPGKFLFCPTFNFHETRMHFVMCLVIVLSSLGFTFLLRDNFVENQSLSNDNDSVILRNILKNYIQKYFSHKKLFVSINISPNDKWKNHYGNDLFNNFFIDSILTNFSYNVLSTLNGSVSGNHNAFNLVLVDESTQLS